MCTQSSVKEAIREHYESLYLSDNEEIDLILTALPLDDSPSLEEADSFENLNSWFKRQRYYR